MSRFTDAICEAADNVREEMVKMVDAFGATGYGVELLTAHAWLAYDMARFAYDSSRFRDDDASWRAYVIARCNGAVQCYADAIGIPPTVG